MRPCAAAAAAASVAVLQKRFAVLVILAGASTCLAFVTAPVPIRLPSAPLRHFSSVDSIVATTGNDEAFYSNGAKALRNLNASSKGIDAAHSPMAPSQFLRLLRAVAQRQKLRRVASSKKKAVSFEEVNDRSLMSQQLLEWYSEGGNALSEHDLASCIHLVLMLWKKTSFLAKDSEEKLRAAHCSLSCWNEFEKGLSTNAKDALLRQEALNAILYCQSETFNFEGMQQLFERSSEKVAPNAQTYQLMLKAYGESGRMEQAEECMVQMQRLASQTSVDSTHRKSTLNLPKPFDYKLLIRSFCVAAAAQKQQRGIAERYAERAESWMHRLQGVGTEGRRNEATVLRENGIRIMVLEAWAKSGNTDRGALNAERLYDDMLQHEGAIGPGQRAAWINQKHYAITVLLQAWSRTAPVSYPDAAFQSEVWLHELKEMARLYPGKGPTTVTYSMAINTWAKSPHYAFKAEKATALLDELRALYNETKLEAHRPNAFVYNAVLNACATTAHNREGMLQTMFDVYKQFEKDDHPNHITFSILFKGVNALVLPGTTREGIVRALFQKCQSRGHLSDGVWRQLELSCRPEFLQELQSSSS